MYINESRRPKLEIYVCCGPQDSLKLTCKGTITICLLPHYLLLEVQNPFHLLSDTLTEAPFSLRWYSELSAMPAVINF